MRSLLPIWKLVEEWAACEFKQPGQKSSARLEAVGSQVADDRFLVATGEASKTVAGVEHKTVDFLDSFQWQDRVFSLSCVVKRRANYQDL